MDSKREESFDKGLRMPKDLAEVSLGVLVCEENVGAYYMISWQRGRSKLCIQTKCH